MILVDLNVVLDVVQQREPHYRASSAVLGGAIRGKVQASLPAHAVTTLHYIVGRYQGNTKANEVVDWLLTHFGIAAAGRAEMVRARALGWPDFEDAVVAAAAESAGCQIIVTRNVGDFGGSPVPTLTPDEYLVDTWF